MNKEKRTIIIDDEEWELADGIFNCLAGIVGKELENVELTDTDGNSYPATICRETKQIWLC